ncbi:MAG TPA: succinyl-diaminopimelate desuccinylase [Legionella sp.]|nr:succinyl-diaminopimelate desuccinylase [Legionella sp.]
MSELKRILSKLISFPSISPRDAGCQNYMIEYLEEAGFSCQRFNKEPVDNFFAVYGTEGHLLVFAGHTDVVPVGDPDKWVTNPFILEEKEGLYFGRGVADMKGSLACMLLMAKRFVTTYPDFKGRMGFLITSGEEGDDYDCGTPYIMEQLQQQNIHIDYCVIGEPSSANRVGDVIKVGRRGSLSAKIHLQGKQGHVAYPHLADNPIHKFSSFLADLTTIEWDKGNEYFPPTSMQVTYIHSGGYAGNIIPGEIDLHLNFRFSTVQTDVLLKNQINHLCKKYEINPEIEWRLSGQPFLTKKGIFLDKCQLAITETTGLNTELSTTGGTSDGRFIAPYGIEVVEIGPVNATIHQINECVASNDLVILEQIYFSIAEKLLLRPL